MISVVLLLVFWVNEKISKNSKIAFIKDILLPLSIHGSFSTGKIYKEEFYKKKTVEIFYEEIFFIRKSVEIFYTEKLYK